MAKAKGETQEEKRDLVETLFKMRALVGNSIRASLIVTRDGIMIEQVGNLMQEFDEQEEPEAHAVAAQRPERQSMEAQIKAMPYVG